MNMEEKQQVLARVLWDTIHKARQPNKDDMRQLQSIAHGEA